MEKMILLLIGLIIIAISVILIYDARDIATKHFNNGEINTATRALKITGFIMAVIAAGIIICVIH